MENEKGLTCVMDEKRRFEVPESVRDIAYIDSMDEYWRIYHSSIEDPEGFWEEKAAELIDWYRKWDKVFTWDVRNAKFSWFEGGLLNVSYNCLDRHIPKRAEKPAIIWVGNEPGVERVITYESLLKDVCRFSNVLKRNGVKRGDRVAIYMPMIPELAIAMLACTRIGAIHSIVFGGFSADSLSERIQDCGACLVITADGGLRGKKTIRIKEVVDEALMDCSTVSTVIVVNRIDSSVMMVEGRDLWWHEEMEGESDESEPEQMDSEDPLFILYTSGSTGKPKGVLHTTGGYLTYVSLTFRWIFDYHEKDVFWCTADIGWITGHSYIVYGPLSNGATSIMFEGTPLYPDPGRFWEICSRWGVTQFYTAPTAIRSIIQAESSSPEAHDLSTLKILGTVGEPINPEAWIWYFKAVGSERCPIVDTWWQTETGGILISPLPGATPTKPGSATFPFPGIEPAILREDGTEAGPNEGGYLVIKKPWPGLMRTVYGHHQRFVDTYWSQYPSYYFTGDSARKDEDGYIWILGRVDDVINVSGHRLGTAEVESALVAHEKVAEAAVVGYPHEIKGQGIHAFVTLLEGVEGTDEFRQELVNWVRKEIGPIATPDKIQFSKSLPKTRSGKIMRRILKKIAAGSIDEIGDLSTLSNPECVDRLIEDHASV